MNTASTTATATRLPTPEERPLADVVVYDGHCRFCTGYAERLARCDKPGQLAYLSLHDPEVARRWPDLQHADLMKQMLLVDQQGGRHWGAEAFRYLSTRIPRLYCLAPLLYLPGSMPVWQWLYERFARRRYHWGRVKSCDDGSCKIHR